MDYLKQIEEYEPTNEQETGDKASMLAYIHKNRQNILTRENIIAHMTCSGFTINKEFTKILMVHHNIYNSWSFIGGHADGEADLRKVAEREVKEETGTSGIVPISEDIISLDILTTKGHFKNGKYVAPHLHFNLCYAFYADESAKIRVKEDENSGVMWIKINELEKYVEEKEMLPVYYKMIDHLKNKMKRG